MLLQYFKGLQVLEKDKSLEICIPHYRDEKNLAVTLRSMAEYLGDGLMTVRVGHRDFESDSQRVKNLCRRYGVFFERSDDNGIYSAFNFLAEKAEADYICFWGAGDTINPMFSISEIIPFLTTDLVLNDIKIVNKKNKDLRNWNVTRCGKFFLGWMPPHPGMFVRSVFYKQVGKFDSNFQISGDYDWIFRAFSMSPTITITNINIMNMRHGGVSSQLKNTLTKMWEDYKVLQRYYYLPAIPTLAKRLRKCNQFF